MVSRIAMAWDNLADRGTITASAQTPLTPASLLLNKHVHQKWRAITTSAFFVCDLGSLQNIDTIAVMGLFGDGLILQVRISTVDTTGAAGDTYNSGVLSGAWDTHYLPFVTLLNAPVLGRYVRVDISGAADYVEAGRVFAGIRHQMSINFQPGWGRSWVDPSVKTIGRSGQAFDDLRDMYRVLEIPFDFLTESDRWDIVEAMDIALGIHGDVLIITDPSSSNLSRDSLWGFMEQIDPVVEPAVLQDRFYRRTFRFRERL